VVPQDAAQDSRGRRNLARALRRMSGRRLSPRHQIPLPLLSDVVYAAERPVYRVSYQRCGERSLLSTVSGEMGLSGAAAEGAFLFSCTLPTRR
jgi:hypothetical protein